MPVIDVEIELEARKMLDAYPKHVADALYWVAVRAETMDGEDYDFLSTLGRVMRYYDEHAAEYAKTTSSRVLEMQLVSDIFGSNIVKQTAKELGMTYKELAEAIGVSEGTIKRVATGEITLQVQKALEMLVRIDQLQKENENVKSFKTLLKKLIE